MTHPPDLPICLTCPEYAHPDSESKQCEACTLNEYLTEQADYDDHDKLEFPHLYAAVLKEIEFWQNERRKRGQINNWREHLEILEAARLERMAE